MKRYLLVAALLLSGCSNPTTPACARLRAGDASTVAGLHGVVVSVYSRSADIGLPGIGKVNLPCDRIEPDSQVAHQ